MIDPVIERHYADCRELMDLWRQYHDYFKVAVAGDGITPEKEHEFITIKSRIAMLHDSFMDCLEHDQNIGQNVLSIITRSITLKHIHRMSTAEIKKIELEWHESYLLLNETLGVLEDRRSQFGEVTPSQYYRQKYTEKSVRAVKNFLTGWVFKSIVALVVLMVVVFAAIQFDVLDRVYQTGWGRNLVMKFENLIRLVHSEYPYREVSSGVFTRMDELPAPTMGEIADESAHTSDPGKYGLDQCIRRVNEKMSGSPNNIAEDLKQQVGYRCEVWNAPYGGYGGQAFLWLLRMPSSATAREIETKYEQWKRNNLTGGQVPDWQFFRKANVLGVIFGGDDIGRLRNYIRDQYMHLRRKR